MKNAFWLLLLPLFSCLDQPDCLRTADTALVISFRKLEGGARDTVVLYQVAAAGADSVFYSPANVPDTLKGVNALLAVNPFNTETLFTFYFHESEKELHVGYNRQVRFVSDECGSEVFLSSLEILNTTFDSVRVVNHQLTKSRVVNIEIFN
ncbi:MAG: hypothetical protein KF845_00180 [Cyclobacteriaceae bacterium]|nr:hypothetical protein [Cyclobacteriaceae bacterium]